MVLTNLIKSMAALILLLAGLALCLLFAMRDRVRAA